MNTKTSFGLGCLIGGVISVVILLITFFGLVKLGNWSGKKQAEQAKTCPKPTLARMEMGHTGVLLNDVCPAAGDQVITDALKPIRQKYRVPAIAGAIVTSKGIENCGVVGVRKSGTEIPATLDDKWHLGSDTKAMTATLIGRLVEQDLLKWDTTVSDVFPDLASTFHPDMKNVTILQLLSHRAGLPANLSRWSTILFMAGAGGTAQAQRIQALKNTFSKKPEFTPESKYQYSNLGYVIAGAIVEKVTGMSWEEAIQDKIFKPLDMMSAPV